MSFGFSEPDFCASPPRDADWPGSPEPGVQFSQSAHTLRTHLKYASQGEVPWEADPPNLWTLGKRRGRGPNGQHRGVSKTQT